MGYRLLRNIEPSNVLCSQHWTDLPLDSLRNSVRVLAEHDDEDDAGKPSQAKRNLFLSLCLPLGLFSLDLGAFNHPPCVLVL